MELGIDAVDRVPWWRALVSELLALPHLVVLYVLRLVLSVATVIGWFAAMFTTRIPPGLQDFQVMVVRYEFRVLTYMLWMRGAYPPFDFTTGVQDPGGDPISLSVQPDETHRRVSIFFRFILMIPLIVVALVYAIGLFVCWIVAFFTVLFTGRWPEGMKRYALNVLQYNARVSVYYALLTDTYPSFNLS